MLALLVLVAGALVTAHFLQQQRCLNAEALAVGFGAAADRIHINHRLRTFQAAMRGVQGFVRSSERISREDFSNYVVSLQAQELLPGVQAIGFVEPLEEAGLAAHLQLQRREFRDNTPGARERHHPCRAACG